MSNSGIYYIQNIVTKQLYIGQSKNLKKRKRRHLSELRNNSHPNKHLQQSFNKYGEQNFKFKVIEYCDSSMLDELELAYMNLYNVKEHGFNINDGGGATPNNAGKNNGMYGKPSPIRRIDIDNCLTEIAKEYEFGVPLTFIAKEWGTARQVLRDKLRSIYSKEEMAEINKRNQKGPFIRHDYQKGMIHPINSRVNMSKSNNTSGYFRVSYDTYDRLWLYKYYDEDKKRKKITSKNLVDLEKKVKEKGLPWIKFE